MIYRSHADELARRLERVKRCESRSWNRGFYHGCLFTLAVVIVLALFVIEGGAP